MLKRIAHPVDILKDELKEQDVSPASFARQIDVPDNRISQILPGSMRILETALSDLVTGPAWVPSSG